MYRTLDFTFGDIATGRSRSANSNEIKNTVIRLEQIENLIRRRDSRSSIQTNFSEGMINNVTELKTQRRLKDSVRQRESRTNV